MISPKVFSYHRQYKTIVLGNLGYPTTGTGYLYYISKDGYPSRIPYVNKKGDSERVPGAVQINKKKECVYYIAGNGDICELYKEVLKKAT